MTEIDDLVCAILPERTDDYRERRLRSLIEEHRRCLEFIRSNADALRSKFTDRNYEDFLDLFAELIWACLLVKAGAAVQPLPCRRDERTPEYRVTLMETDFYAECRHLREPEGVTVQGDGRISTMFYSPKGFGGEHDCQAARRISDAILGKLS